MRKSKTKRREEILNSAQKVVLKYGYHGATMDRIAKDARITKGLIYIYFKNKKDLILSVIERQLFDFEEKLKSVRTHKELTSTQKLDKVIKLLFENWSKNREFHRFYDPESGLIPTALRKKFKKRLRPRFESLLSLIKDIIEEGIERKEFRNLAPEAMPFIIHGVLIGIHKMTLFREGKNRIDESEIIKELLFRGILKR